MTKDKQPLADVNSDQKVKKKNQKSGNEESSKSGKKEQVLKKINGPAKD